MRSALIASTLIASIAAVGCGPNNGAGFQISGDITASVTGGGPSQSSGFSFAAPNGGRVRLDTTLPAGQPTGTTGVCRIGPNGRTLQLTRVGDDGTLGVRSITINLPAWEQDTCQNCAHGDITVQLASGTFTGGERRGSTPSQCTFNATRSSSFGMDLSVQCTGLTATGDTRTLDVAGNLSMIDCDGPETRN